jgi:anti-anti-sigma regulatory factor
MRDFIVEPENELELDFSDVENIRMADIQKLLDLQKMIIFHEIKIKVGNLRPEILKILEQTGLYKTLKGTSASEKVNKRLGLAMD